MGGVACAILYKLIFKWFPISYKYGKIGEFSRYVRRCLCKRIFEHCGDDTNIEHGADFGYGLHVILHHSSSLGIHCHVPSDIEVGANCMIGPNFYVEFQSHNFERVDIPKWQQGMRPKKKTKIGNDVWIGRDVYFTPGRSIADGCVIAAKSVVTKDFPPYTVIGGNPAKAIMHYDFEQNKWIKD